MTVSREAAEYLRVLLTASCPGDDVKVTPTPGGLRVEVSGVGSYLRADVSSPDSPVLRMLVTQGRDRTASTGPLRSVTGR